MSKFFNKLRQSELFQKDNIKAVIIMALFTFVFLSAEFLYVNIISVFMPDSKAVMVQNYALGVSALGFLIYPVISRFCRNKFYTMFNVFIAVISVLCIFCICRNISYSVTFAFGLLLFLLLGIFGSTVFYKSVCLLENNKYLARIVGISYMLGILLQFMNNNIIRSETVEAVVLSAFFTGLIALLIKSKPMVENASAQAGNEEVSENFKESPKSTTLGLLLILLVALMTCIFSTLDNAVTLSHTAGKVNIGQWPRIFLAVSGLAAGFVFDINNRKFMNHIMYCVMLLSTICIAVFEFSGPFLSGLIIFYMSAGFFAVFFTSAFMELARHTKTPELWAGLGRAVNNLTAAVITGASLKLLSGVNVITVITIILLLFAAVSIVTAIYTNKKKVVPVGNILSADDTARLQGFSERFALTSREREVLSMLVNTEDSIQTISESLYISRRTLERHISSIYEKTGAKSRIGLILIYNEN